MAKVPRKLSGKIGKVKRATKERKASARTPAAPDADAHIDACDLEFHESEATPDAELPTATGGVETLRRTRGRTAHRWR